MKKKKILITLACATGAALIAELKVQDVEPAEGAEH